MAYSMRNQHGHKIVAYDEKQRKHWEGQGFKVTHTAAFEPHHALLAGLADWEIEESKGATPPSSAFSFCLR